MEPVGDLRAETWHTDLQLGGLDNRNPWDLIALKNYTLED